MKILFLIFDLFIFSFSTPASSAQSLVTRASLEANFLEFCPVFLAATLMHTSSLRSERKNEFLSTEKEKQFIFS